MAAPYIFCLIDYQCYKVFYSPIRSFILVTALLISVPVIVVPNIVLAQETADDAEMEEALSGFDEEDSGIEDALSGFDEEKNIKHNEETKALFEKEAWSSFYGYTGISLSYSFVREPPEDNSNSESVSSIPESSSSNPEMASSISESFEVC